MLFCAPYFVFCLYHQFPSDVRKVQIQHTCRQHATFTIVLCHWMLLIVVKVNCCCQSPNNGIRVHVTETTSNVPSSAVFESWRLHNTKRVLYRDWLRFTSVFRFNCKTGSSVVSFKVFISDMILLSPNWVFFLG